MVCQGPGTKFPLLTSHNNLWWEVFFSLFYRQMLNNFPQDTQHSYRGGFKIVNVNARLMVEEQVHGRDCCLCSSQCKSLCDVSLAFLLIICYILLFQSANDCKTQLFYELRKKMQLTNLWHNVISFRMFICCLINKFQQYY